MVLVPGRTISCVNGAYTFNNGILIPSNKSSATKRKRSSARNAESTKSPGSFCVYRRRNGTAHTRFIILG